MALLRAEPYILLVRDRQDIGLWLGHQPPLQLAISPYTLPPVTHGAGAPAAKARASICRATCGLVAKRQPS